MGEQIPPKDLPDPVAFARQLQHELLSDASSGFRSSPVALDQFRRRLLAARAKFGVTRVGSITRLDRVGIPVVQVVRPDSRSNAVAQGKGKTTDQAILSAMMETVEAWAAERTEGWRTVGSTAAVLEGSVADLYADFVVRERRHDWHETSIRWLKGFDLAADMSVDVPMALVDANYRWPSIHPPIFQRTTTGLGAGSSKAEATAHAILEIMERDAIFDARRRHGFFDDFQIDPDTIEDQDCLALIAAADRAGLIVGIWLVPARHGLPVIWCQVIEDDRADRLLPLPSEGFGCDFRPEAALEKALLEALQARLAALSGAREDITRHAYHEHVDERELEQWRRKLREPVRSRPFPHDSAESPKSWRQRWQLLRRAMEKSSARACILCPLLQEDDTGAVVVRAILPPLAAAAAEVHA